MSRARLADGWASLIPPTFVCGTSDGATLNKKVTLPSVHAFNIPHSEGSMVFPLDDGLYDILIGTRQVRANPGDR